MNRYWKIVVLSFAGVVVGSSSALFAEPPKGDAKADGNSELVPWVRKATKDLPKNRTGGNPAQKGIAGTDASLFFVAPKTTGLTAREWPDVYWYISHPSKRVTFTLLRADQRNKTLLRLEHFSGLLLMGGAVVVGVKLVVLLSHKH